MNLDLLYLVMIIAFAIGAAIAIFRKVPGEDTTPTTAQPAANIDPVTLQMLSLRIDSPDFWQAAGTDELAPFAVAMGFPTFARAKAENFGGVQGTAESLEQLWRAILSMYFACRSRGCRCFHDHRQPDCPNEKYCIAVWYEGYKARRAQNQN